MPSTLIHTSDQVLKLLENNITAAADGDYFKRQDYIYHLFQSIDIDSVGTVAPVDIMFSIDGSHWVKWDTITPGTIKSYTGLIPYVKAVRTGVSVVNITVLMHSAGQFNELN